jgi:hypothetical protein
MSVSFYANAEGSTLEANYSNSNAGRVLEAMGFLADSTFEDACVGECSAVEFERRCYSGLGKGLEPVRFSQLVRVAREAKALGVPVFWG